MLGERGEREGNIKILWESKRVLGGRKGWEQGKQILIKVDVEHVFGSS